MFASKGMRPLAASARETVVGELFGGEGMMLAAGTRRVIIVAAWRDVNKVQRRLYAYITTNSPFLTRQVWDAEVTKMIKAFGAPISDADSKEIAEYLTKNYGQQP